MSGRVLSVCVAAPSEGVLVDAPEKMPSTAAVSKPASQPMSGALDRAENDDRRREQVQLHALLPQRREEAGTELETDREDEQRSAQTPSRNRACDDRPVSPKCPTRIPAKSTPAVPRPMPRNFKLPSAIPSTQTNASTPMACATGCAW